MGQTDEQLVLTFFRGKMEKVIARTDDGKICFLDIPYCKGNRIWINEGEEWNCGFRDAGKVLVVQPIVRTKTADENKKLLEEKARQFAKQGFKQREFIKKRSPGNRKP